MTRRAALWSAIAALACGTLAWYYGAYGAFSDADKACLRAREGASAEQALAQLRSVAQARGVEVRQSGGRTSAVFGWMFTDIAACSFGVRDGKVVDVQVGKRALDALR